MQTDNLQKEKVLAETANQIGVDLVLLFGSRADGTNKENSDYDIAYRSDKFPFESESEIFSAVANFVGSDNLHLVNLRNIKPLILYEIMRNCKVLYAKNMMDFYDLRASTFRRFEDEVKPLYQTIFNKLKAEYLT